MEKIRRILAACGAVLLVVMYGSTLFFAVTDHSQTMGLLKASIVCTFVIPVLLYAYTLVYRTLQSGRPPLDEENRPKKEGRGVPARGMALLGAGPFGGGAVRAEAPRLAAYEPRLVGRAALRGGASGAAGAAGASGAGAGGAAGSCCGAAGCVPYSFSCTCRA